MSVIQRMLLPERPVFFLDAGRRGSGKTTVLKMLHIAVTGIQPPAAAWSREERRKALLAYLLAGVPSIIWDNIPRGSQISCPHIERSCTTAFYSDRVLGASQTATAAASAIHLFTGNNIGPRGDLASRALIARLEVDRPDPENRDFVHPDPFDWTEAHRARILKALYTVLLGNPALWPNSIPPRTRFKSWWQLVGAPVEHAARLCDIELDFQSLFLEQEGEEEDSASLTDVLRVFTERWPNNYSFDASDVARLINDTGIWAADRECGVIVRAVLFPELNNKANQLVDARAVGVRLKQRVGEPVKAGTETLCLRLAPKPPGRADIANSYYVHVT